MRRLRTLRAIMGKVTSIVLALTLLCGVPAGNVYAQNTSKKSTARSNSKGAASNTRKGSAKGGGQTKTRKSAGKSTKGTSGSAGLSADELKRREQSAQEEVKKTQQELKKNEAEVKRNLSELSRLENDIAVSKKESDVLTAEVGQLEDKIGDLETKISTETRELERLRSEYLKAIKKMRVSRKRHSGMSYLFSAKDLAQAERRMRYLKEFSEWKDRQTRDIQAKVAELSKANDQLKQAKSAKDVVLGRELKVQTKLSEQKQRQSVVVAELKANGAALRNHLAKKQGEVNALRNQVAAVIAEEQRRAEADRRKREEAARAEQERIARQKAAEEAAKAERERVAKEKAAKEQAAKEQAAREAAAKEQARQTQQRTSTKDVTVPPAKAQNKKESSSQDYASARNRKPRNDAGKGKNGKYTKGKDTRKEESAKPIAPQKPAPANENVAPKPAAKPAGNFGNHKGALPRPVAGAWRVTDRFGRHALPDLPDVIFDNPGIDVEVSKGASVKSVYGGEVSGVYVVPGFSTVVIVSHGDYYTVYGNIGKASVKVGESVKQGQTIGTLTDDADNPGHSTLHFEVWKGREKLNPQLWIQ